MYIKMKVKYHTPVKVLWVLGILLLFQACYPGDSIPIDDLDTTSTFFNSDGLAPAPASAAIVWDVVEIIDEDDPDNNIPYDGEVDDEILNTTLDELVKLYGESNVVIISETPNPGITPSNPNVQIVVPGIDPDPDVDALYNSSIMLRIKTVGVVYPGYPWWPGGGWWGGWYPGYPGYPCYYCGYPPTVSYSRYEVGTVISDMFDLRQIPAGSQPPADYDPSWIAINRGLISKNTDFNATRVTAGIKLAFTQSPYLKP